MLYVDANKLCFALEDGMYIYEISDKQIKSLFNKDDNEYIEITDNSNEMNIYRVLE